MFIIGLLFVLIILPIWLVLHYLTTWRNSRSLSRRELDNIEAIWQLANQMEARIKAVETMLDLDKTQGSRRHE